MKRSSIKRKICAPAAMLLAAAVSTAISAESLPAPATPQPDLSWALNGAGCQTVRAARAFLARKAANRIRDLDRLSGAAPRDSKAFPAALEFALSSTELPAFGEAHVSSSHQHSAP